MSDEEITINSLCLNCFQRGHDNDDCSNFGIHACTKCYRFNVATAQCNCTNRKQPDPPQLLRLVGDHIGPHWYIDVKILDKVVHAMINTSIKRCRINQNFALWIQSCSKESIDDRGEIHVPIKRKATTYEIRCQILESQANLLEVGTAFLKYFGFRFTFDGTTISSDHSHIASHPSETEYVYNVPAIGKDLREFLTQKRKFLKKGRVVKTLDWLPKRQPERIVVIRQNSPTESNEDSE